MFSFDLQEGLGRGTWVSHSSTLLGKETSGRTQGREPSRVAFWPMSGWRSWMGSKLSWGPQG